jgi:hypothetical protein
MKATTCIVTIVVGTDCLPEYLSSHPDIGGVHVSQSLVFYVVFRRLLFILLSFFIWPL